MRVLSRLLAAPVTIGSKASLNTEPLALLPPIPLYRRILRAHRKKLPAEMRLLGDEYVKSEFRAHRSSDNPIHIVWINNKIRDEEDFRLTNNQVGFLTEWQLYAQEIEGDTWQGRKLDKSKVEKMNGLFGLSLSLSFWIYLTGLYLDRSANWPTLRTYASNQKQVRGK
jgi:hypothetical protein